jgi:prophage regulatory protein
MHKRSDIAPYFMREPELHALTGLSRQWRANLERQGRFPVARRIGSRGVGWVRAEIMEWLTTRPPVRRVERATTEARG